MNIQSFKGSNRSSNLNTTKGGLKSKSSIGLKEDNTIDSQVLKNNLQEFYKTSKEKLLKLKFEVQYVNAENEKQKAENKELNLRYLALLEYNEELNLRLKGMKEKLIYANKNKATLQNQIRDLTKEVESTTREIDTMKIDNNYKIKLIQNDIDHINVIKENNLNSIRKKIENEEAFRDNLNEKITEIKGEINKYKNLILELTEQDSIRTKGLLKETAEMTKFLAEI